MVEFYKLLNIPRTASLAEIKVAYRQLAKELHPDVNKGNEAKTARFRDIASAYEVLSDVESRSKYDRSIGAPEVRRVSNRRYTPPPRSGQTNSSKYTVDPASVSYGRIRYNVEEWNAWHYGDEAIVDALKRRAIRMSEMHAANPKLTKRQLRDAEERLKEAHDTSVKESAAGVEQEKIARANLARSREARRREADNRNESLCVLS